MICTLCDVHRSICRSLVPTAGFSMDLWFIQMKSLMTSAVYMLLTS